MKDSVNICGHKIGCVEIKNALTFDQYEGYKTEVKALSSGSSYAEDLYSVHALAFLIRFSEANQDIIDHILKFLPRIFIDTFKISKS